MNNNEYSKNNRFDMLHENINITEKYITDIVNNNKDQLQKCLDFMDTLVIPSGDSISRSDVAFLQAVCLEDNPNAIMEIGTWVGTSAYAMTVASEAEVYTCDLGDNVFVDIEEYSNRIHLHPNTHSDVFLKKELPKFDMVFVDGFHTDAKSIFDACEDSFTLVVHDYFNVDTLDPCKGMSVIWRISEYARNNNYTYNMYPTSRDWIPAGYPVFGFGGVNASCGMIKVRKTYG